MTTLKIKFRPSTVNKRERNNTGNQAKIISIFSQKEDANITFFTFMRKVIAQLKQLDKIRTSETYTTTLNNFINFRQGKDLLPEEIDATLMAEYEAWLKMKNIAMNTISFYNRILRAVYNRAVENELTQQRYPFRYVYTGIEKTVKRAIPFDTIKQIKELDLPPASDFARDMFLFSLYTRGMSFIDMVYLKKSDLKNGSLTYHRRKTGQPLFIHWEHYMQEIIEKYNTKGSPYLLPIIKNSGKNERKQYKSTLFRINQQLKKIGIQLGLSAPLTMYVARHSWANIAKNKNIPISVISEGMGHDSEATTKIYLKSLDATVVDMANLVVLEGL